jgi:hypothetical protein
VYASTTRLRVFGCFSPDPGETIRPAWTPTSKHHPPLTITLEPTLAQSLLLEPLAHTNTKLSSCETTPKNAILLNLMSYQVFYVGDYGVFHCCLSDLHREQVEIGLFFVAPKSFHRTSGILRGVKKALCKHNDSLPRTIGKWQFGNLSYINFFNNLDKERFVCPSWVFFLVRELPVVHTTSRASRGTV